MNNQIKSTLPHKELSLFKRIVKCYEQKQFKNGLKFAKQILSNSKFCEHGETLAMKGLILSCTGKRDEAYECVKRGIKNDINSSICWHVYGLVQKSDRKYDEAMKCYLRALKMDKDNIQILRDLSLLQIQMRNFEGYLETRGQLFQLRPSQKASWLGYVVAQHLLENYDEAIRILDEFTKVQQNIPPYNIEHSELLMYYAMLLMESGKHETALDFLTEHEKSIVDKVNLMEFRGELSLKLERTTEAHKIYNDLIDRNPENDLYYEKLLQSMKIGSDDEAQMLMLFDSLIEKYPRALMPRWIPLKKLHGSGEKFRDYADSYLKKCLRKGVWALFVQLKFLYVDQDKVAVLESLYEQYKRDIYTHQSLDGPEGPVDPPTVEIYVNYLLAEHYSHVGRLAEALQIVDNQLSHTPTLTEFYSLKGKIFYDGGNTWLASKCLDEAQSMDTADRFVNCLCTRYMVEAGRFSDAEEMAGKFTREGMRSVDNLNEMQCMWFLNTMARACQRLHRYADALQKCHEVNKHFFMMVDDQFDFHSYCLRKTTLRSYVELLRTEDQLRNHQFYFNAAKIAIEVYLHINDHPVGPEGDDHLDMENLSISEAKKLKSKQRRQKKKAENEAIKKQQEQEKRDQIQKLKSQDKEDPEMVEEKIDGAKLIRTTAPLDEATKFLQPLLTLSPRNLESQCLAFTVYEKKGKILLMLKAIKSGLKISGSVDNPSFHECLVRFLHGVVKEKLATSSDTVRAVVAQSLRDMASYGLDSVDRCSDLNQQFLARNKGSILHEYYAWHMGNFLSSRGTGTSPDYSALLGSLCPTGARWQDCELILGKLRTVYGLKDADPVYNSLRERFSVEFSQCASFMTPSQTTDSQNTPIVITATHFYPSNGEQSPAAASGLPVAAAAATDHIANGYLNNNTSSSSNNNNNNNVRNDNNDDDDEDDNESGSGSYKHNKKDKNQLISQ